MSDRLYHKLWDQHAKPLLTEKQLAKRWTKPDRALSKAIGYQKALDLVDAEWKRKQLEFLDFCDEMAAVVKAEIPEGFKFASNFYISGLPGFYKSTGSCEPGKRNCANCIIRSDGTYWVWGTDGYEGGDLLGHGVNAKGAATIANNWLAGGDEC
jgi:hypothetical protein